MVSRLDKRSIAVADYAFTHMVLNRPGLGRSGELVVSSLMALLLLAPATSVSALPTLRASEAETTIEHEDLECWPEDEHVVLRTAVNPSQDIAKVTFHFRWDRHADWYFVPASRRAPGVWEAVMPKTEPGTTGTVYYAEVLTSDYTATRSSEVRVPVRDRDACNPAPPTFSGNPGTTVGATQANGFQVPPGFQDGGIARFISPNGTITPVASGGGIGKKAAIIGGVGAGAAGAIFAFGGGNDPSPSPSPIVTTTTATAGGGTTTTVGGGATSTTTTTASSGGVTTTTILGSTTTIVGSSTTTAGSSTTTTAGSSTTTTAGSSTTTTAGSSTTTSAGSSTTTTVGTTTTTVGSTTSTSTTTVASTTTTAGSTTTITTTTSVPTTSSSSTSTSSSTTTSTGGCSYDLRPLVSDSPDPVGNPLPAFLTYTIQLQEMGVGNATFASAFIDSKPAPSGGGGTCTTGNPGQCSFGTVPVGSITSPMSAVFIVSSPGNLSGSVRSNALGCDANNGNNNVNISTTAQALRAPERGQVHVLLRSELSMDGDSSARGSIKVNDAVPVATHSGSAHVIGTLGRTGENRLTARLLPPRSGAGRWSLSFEGASNFVPGSLEVESGRVVSVSDRAAVFAVDEDAGPIRLKFELRAPGRRQQR